MENRIYLNEGYFTDKETVIFSNGELSASLFTYQTGVKAVRLSNKRGYIVVLPYMGQMIWRACFDGRELAMKSIHDIPENAKDVYGETYGCFLMHCGLTAMGNPTPEDTHLPHGEIPIAKYNNVYILVGEDENGSYIGLTGTFSFKRCFEYNYDFSPVHKIYAGKTKIGVTATFTNNKDVPLEYYYLCHINHRPVENARLCYTAKRSDIKVNHEVPENYFDPAKAQATNDYLNRLDKDQSIMDVVDSKTQSYAPEIVFSMKYQADENGNAYTMQVSPDGSAVYVIHKPEELPFGTRWIARTEDEDAMGMVLPATSEHMGRLYCQRNNQQRYLKKGETVVYHMETGLLNKEEATAMLGTIKKMGF